MQKHNNFYQHIKKIGIITYQAPHLKTEQVLERLLAIYGGGYDSYLCPTFYKKRGESRAVCS